MKLALGFILALTLAASAMAQPDAELLAAASARLLESESPGYYRDRALAVLLRDRDHARRVATQLAEREDWHDLLTAMAIWSRLGADVFIEEAISKRSLIQSPNMAIRLRSLEALIGHDASLLNDHVLEALNHSLWLERRAALQVLATSSLDLQLSSLPALANRLQDPIAEIRVLARGLLLELCQHDARVLHQVLSSPWWDWDSPRDKRELVWAVMDAQARGWEVPIALLATERADTWSRYLALLAPGAASDRLESFLALARDPSHQHLIGDDLIAAMVSLLAEDPRSLESLKLPKFGQPALYRLTNLVLPQANRSLRLALIKLMLRNGLEGDRSEAFHEQLEEEVLLAAFAAPPPGLAALLDERFKELKFIPASRARCRRVLRLRASLNVLITDDFIFDMLQRGSVAQRVVMAEHIWQRGDAQLRLSLLDWLVALEPKVAAREPILALVLAQPKDEAQALVRRLIRDATVSERLRLRALDVAIKMNWGLEFEVSDLRAAPDDLRLRLLGYELGRGQRGQELLEAEIAGSAIKDLNPALLRLAARAQITAVDDALRLALAQGEFNPTSLPVYLDYLGERFGPELRELELKQFLERCLSLSAEERERSGFAQLDGKVIEHLLRDANPKLALPRLFELASLPSMREPDRVIAALAALATRRGQQQEFQSLIRQRWAATANQSALERASLARELVLHGDSEARSLMAEEGRRALAACVGKDLMRDEVYSAAVILEWIFQAFVEAGDAAGMKLALSLMAAAEDLVLEAQLAGTNEPGGFLPRNSMFSALVAELRDRPLPPGFALELRALPAARGDPSFWQDLSRQLLRFPAWGSLDEVVAQGLLSWPANLHRLQDHVLRSLGLRLMRGTEPALGAELYRLGRQLELSQRPAAAADLDRIMVAGVEDRRGEFWNLLEAKLLMAEKLEFSLASLAHRRGDERRFLRFVALGLESPERDRFRAEAATWQASPELAARDRLALRLALDERQFEAAREMARNALRRIAVFGKAGLDGEIRVFTAFEAAALWGLERQDEARVLLRSIGVVNLGELEGPRASDFR